MANSKLKVKPKASGNETAFIFGGVENKAKDVSKQIYTNQTVKNAIYLQQLGSKAKQDAFEQQHGVTVYEYEKRYREQQKQKNKSK